MPITGLYAALLSLIFVFLSVRTIRLRQALRVSLGDAGEKRLQRAIRVHGNFAEYVPLALLMIYFVESTAASRLFVHALGLCLLAGRLLHAYGVSQAQERLIYRISGMALTFSCLLVAALYLLYIFIALQIVMV